MKLTMYGYPKCSTCRKALKKLESMGHEVDMINVFEQAPSADTIEKWLQQSAVEPRKLFNTSGEVYREMKLKDKLGYMNREEMVGLLASEGRLIKRPVVTGNGRITIGYREPEYEEVWT
ncbi:arsenate reductase family protein [Paenibacillus senegalensis]|uniref:arsenate reductase family protein n=1 Tax=Paenibacillus senegalensis TaxID=1465766 RepID=UPI000288EE98|nr:arsenate reductase family protein [Paenibacillus senegalensis]